MHVYLSIVRGNEVPTDIACALATRLVAGASGVTASEIVSAGQTRSVSTARQIAMYLAHTAAGLTLTAVAEYFGRDRTTAAHACRIIEDRRDDDKFDAEIAELEDLFRAIFGGAR